VGKGTKVIMVSDGNRVPIGLYLDSAHHHKIRLAEATLKTVRVLGGEDVPEHAPRNWWLTRLMTAVLSELDCADGGSSLPFPPFTEKAANPVVVDHPCGRGISSALDH